MKSLIVLVLFFAASDAWFFSSPKKPEWNSLYITFGSFNQLPTTKDDAVYAGWRLNKTCNGRNYFAGNRYVLDGDTAVMLLFGANGQLAGIQMGVARSVVGTKANPWVLEGDMYVMTAYFTDPRTICSRRQARKHYGDRLLILDGTTNSTIVIPFKEEDLTGSRWVAGRCFPLMGQHYWYDISANMNCKDFYPVFIMYNGNRLDSFGWNTYGDLKSKRYEHPTSDKLSYFPEEDITNLSKNRRALEHTTHLHGYSLQQSVLLLEAHTLITSQVLFTKISLQLSRRNIPILLTRQK